MARQFNPESFQLYGKIGTTLPSGKQTLNNFTCKQPTYLTAVQVSTPIQSPVSPVHQLSVFQRSSPRPKQVFKHHQAHPLRFVPFNDKPLVYSNIKKITSPRMQFYSGHANTHGTRDISDQDQYSPNLKTVHKRSPTHLLPWNRITGRPQYQIRSLSSDLDDLNVSYSAQDKQKPSFEMEKCVKKKVCEEVPLFMNQPTSRGGLRFISEKTLQMNNYREGKSSKLGSTFAAGWYSQKTKRRPIMGQCPKIVTIIHEKLKANELLNKAQ